MSSALSRHLLSAFERHGLAVPPAVLEYCTFEDVYDAIVLCTEIVRQSWAPLALQIAGRRDDADFVRNQIPGIDYLRAPMLCEGCWLSHRDYQAHELSATNQDWQSRMMCPDDPLVQHAWGQI